VLGTLYPNAGFGGASFSNELHDVVHGIWLAKAVWSKV
jgi:hypothetical protein